MLTHGSRWVGKAGSNKLAKIARNVEHWDLGIGMENPGQRVPITTWCEFDGSRDVGHEVRRQNKRSRLPDFIDILLYHSLRVEVMQVVQLPVCDFRNVGEGRPDEVGDVGFFAGGGEVLTLLDFPIKRGFFPVLVWVLEMKVIGEKRRERYICYTEDSVGAFDGAEDRVFAVEVRLETSVHV